MQEEVKGSGHTGPFVYSGSATVECPARLCEWEGYSGGGGEEMGPEGGLVLGR